MAKGKNNARKTREVTQAAAAQQDAVAQGSDFKAKVIREQLTPKTAAQSKLLNAIRTGGDSKLIFAIGCAGTGKTYVPVAYASQQLLDGAIERIVITRPTVDTGDGIGFLPGSEHEKLLPYLMPIIDVLEQYLGGAFVQYQLEKGKRIVASDLGKLRGSTFRNSVIILDEAQNVTPAQMKMFLTRIGENCTVVVTGDLKQTDLHGQNGLGQAVALLKGKQGVSVVEFTKADIVRSGLVQRVVEAYEDAGL